MISYAEYLEREWLPSELECLRSLWLDGLPRRIIAARLKRTPEAVRRKAKRLGLPARDEPPEAA
jgi:hypothetical protein